MKLYYARGTCSLGIHLLLEEIGVPFTLEPVNLHAREQVTGPLGRINPKHKVPVLERDDGSVLTEYPAIAVWLARTHPASDLLPTDAEGEARALELVEDLGGPGAG